MGFETLHLCYEFIVKAFLIVLLPNGSLEHRRDEPAQGIMLLSRQGKMQLDLFSDDFGKFAFNFRKRPFEFVVLCPFDIKGVKICFPKDILGRAPLPFFAIFRKNPYIWLLPGRRVGVYELPEIELWNVMLFLRVRHESFT